MKKFIMIFILLFAIFSKIYAITKVTNTIPKNSKTNIKFSTTAFNICTSIAYASEWFSKSGSFIPTIKMPSKPGALKENTLLSSRLYCRFWNFTKSTANAGRRLYCRWGISPRPEEILICYSYVKSFFTKCQ